MKANVRAMTSSVLKIIKTKLLNQSKVKLFSAFLSTLRSCQHTGGCQHIGGENKIDRTFQNNSQTK